MAPSGHAVLLTLINLGYNKSFVQADRCSEENEEEGELEEDALRFKYEAEKIGIGCGGLPRHPLRLGEKVAEGKVVLHKEALMKEVQNSFFKERGKKANRYANSTQSYRVYPLPTATSAQCP